MIKPRHGEWWIGKWSGTDFNCVMQYSAETKDWHDTGIESFPTEHSFDPISKMEQAKPEPQKQFKYEKVADWREVTVDTLDSIFIDEECTVAVRDASTAELLCSQLYRKVETGWVDILLAAIKEGKDIGLGNVQVGNKDLTDDQFVKMCCDIADNVRNR